MKPKRSGTEAGADTVERTRALVADGLTPPLAAAVARGFMDLSEAVERMAREASATTIAERHGMPRSVAMQVAMGQLPLESVLRRMRYEEHRVTHRDRSGFSEGASVGMSLFGGQRPSGRIAAVSSYELTLEPEAGDALVIRKLAVKYVHPLADLRRVRKSFRMVRDRAAPSPEPATQPQDRYPLSDRRLFEWIDRSDDLEVVFLDGEQLHGRATWLSRFEFGLALKGDAEVAACRHAIGHIGRA